MQVDCDLLQLWKIHLEKLTMLEFMKLIESGKFYSRAKVSSSGKCAPNVANLEKGKLSTAAPLTSGFIAVNKQDLITTHRTRFARQL